MMTLGEDGDSDLCGGDHELHQPLVTSFVIRRYVLILQVPRAGNYNVNMSKTHPKSCSLFDG